MTDNRLAGDLRAIGRHLAQAQLRESVSELASELRTLLVDLPQYIVSMDRVDAEVLVEKISVVLTLCDVVRSESEYP